MRIEDQVPNDDVDFFSDGDLAEPELLPEKQRYIGRVSKVDISQAEPGKFRKITSKAGVEREVPIIRVVLTTLRFSNGTAFAADQNFRLPLNQDYWIGREDKIGRHSLARLIMKVAGLTTEELANVAIRDAAIHYLPNALVTYEVKHRAAKIQGVDVKVQDVSGLRAATAEEKAAVL